MSPPEEGKLGHGRGRIREADSGDTGVGKRARARRTSVGVRPCRIHWWMVTRGMREGRASKMTLPSGSGPVPWLAGYLVPQPCPTLCDPMDGSLPGSSGHGILQARILKWIAMPSWRGSSNPRDQTQVSGLASRFFTD